MMAYQKPGFVVAIISPDGKPYREFTDGSTTCTVPFGTEYKIRIKNKTRARARVSVDIDGMPVFVGQQLIMDPDSTTDLERFVDNLSTGKKFKFVEAKAENGVQDPTSEKNGLVRVTVYPEDTETWVPKLGPSLNWTLDSFQCSTLENTRGFAPTCEATYSCSSAAPAGATVGGSLSSQSFTLSTQYFPVLAPISFDIWLKGPQVSAKPALGNGPDFTIEVSQNRIYICDRDGRSVDAHYIGLDGDQVVIGTKDFAFASQFLESCCTLTKDGFRITASSKGRFKCS